MSPKRRQLSAALRTRRERAGLTTTELAAMLSWSQSKVSRLETSRTRPGPTEVEAWARACGVDEAALTSLLELADDVATEAASWRALYGGAGSAAARQQAYRDLNAQAVMIGIYQPPIVPGLVQTAEYARRVFELHGVAPEDVPAATNARIERQTVLYDESKSVELLITEAALRLRVTSFPAHLAQLDKIATMATLANVSIGIIPWTALATALPMSPMVLRDLGDGERLATVETVTTELMISGEDADRCWDIFARQRTAAVFGPEAAAELDRIRRSLNG